MSWDDAVRQLERELEGYERAAASLERQLANVEQENYELKQQLRSAEAELEQSRLIISDLREELAFEERIGRETP